MQEPDEPGLDDFRGLNDPARRREVERRGGFFVVEGVEALKALVGSRYPVRTVLSAENQADRVRQVVGERAPILVRTREDLAALAGFNFHRGVLASADRLPPRPLADVVAGARLVLAVVEGVNDHENLGALFRNAAAFGVGGVVLDPTTADPLYRRSVRVSMGHVLRVPWGRAATWPDDLDVVREAGFVLVALTPSIEADPIDDLVVEAPERVAVLLGAEGPGLRATALAAADRRVRIPLAPGVDSVNVATAAAVAFHRLSQV